MYEAFYGLKESPFSIQPDPDYLYFGRRHTYAYAMMEYGIRDKAGFIVISGEIGCGKTTLVRHLLNNLSAANLTVGLVYNTHREIADLLEWIMLSLGYLTRACPEWRFMMCVQRFLIEQYGQGKSVLLIVDEAQNINADALESCACCQISMLTNISCADHAGRPAAIEDLALSPRAFAVCSTCCSGFPYQAI